MMTLLEFAVEKCLGSPTHSKGDRESQWDCPQCGHPRFHTMPHKPQFKDRFLCWSCGFRGDLPDWLKEMHPDESFGDRLDRLEQLRAEHKLAGGAKAPIIPRGGENQLEGIPVLFSLETAAVLEAAMDDGWNLDKLLFDLGVQLLERGEEIAANEGNGRRKGDTEDVEDIEDILTL